MATKIELQNELDKLNKALDMNFTLEYAFSKGGYYLISSNKEHHGKRNIIIKLGKSKDIALYNLLAANSKIVD